MTITVRPATPADDAMLLQIDRLTWSTQSSPAPAPDWSARTSFFSGEHGPGDFLMAELDGEVVGYIGLHQHIDSPSHAHVLTIDGLAVLPAAQGQGAGRALVQAAVALAAERDARKVTLRVLAHNTEARRLYERCGFVVEGVLEGEFHLDGRDVDDVLMARSLSGP